MTTRLTLRLPLVAATALATMLAVGCSGSQQDDESLDSSSEENNNSANLGNNDAPEGNSKDNQYQEAGADVNNATEDDTSAPANPTLNAAGGAPVNQAAIPANPAPANAAPVEQAPAPAAAATAESPVPGGRVRYVREGGTQVMNGPNGQPVLTLDQGEHPVTWEENGWLRITNGMYVPKNSMSDKGVPRAKTAKGAWSH